MQLFMDDICHIYYMHHFMGSFFINSFPKIHEFCHHLKWGDCWPKGIIVLYFDDSLLKNIYEN